MSLHRLWQRLAGAAPPSRHRQLADAIAQVGPLNPLPGMGRFHAAEPRDGAAAAAQLFVLVPDEHERPRWLDVSVREGEVFLHHRFYLLDDAVQVVRLRDSSCDEVQRPVADGEESVRAWALFDRGIALLQAHCAARDAAHAAWRERIDRDAALRVILTLFGPWDPALRAATKAFDQYTGHRPPDPPRDAAALDGWLWLHVMEQGQRAGRPLVEFLVDDRGSWVADRCREQKEPPWAREFKAPQERRCNAEQVGDAFAGFLAQRGWRLVMYAAELGKPLPAADAQALVALAPRAGFHDLSLRATTPP